MSAPRVSFGVIVLNGEPFTRYCLRALYPHAHELLVVEGAVRAAAACATPDGHSRDGTLEVLERFQREEDPEGKVRVITREGLWSEKDAQSRAWAERATGDWIWQVDVDEFYRERDLRRVLAILGGPDPPSMLSFRQRTFWGGFDASVDGWYLRRGADAYDRVFRWGPEHRYAGHRPPTVHDARGRDLREGDWLRAADTERLGIRLYHYSLVFPQQVRDKCCYYQAADWAERPGAVRWAEEVFERLRSPYRVHNVYQLPSWLERFAGDHPGAIDSLRADLGAGRVMAAQRPRADVDRLLASRRYRLGRAALRLAARVDAPLWRLRRRLRARLRLALGRT